MKAISLLVVTMISLSAIKDAAAFKSVYEDQPPPPKAAPRPVVSSIEITSETTGLRPAAAPGEMLKRRASAPPGNRQARPPHKDQKGDNQAGTINTETMSVTKFIKKANIVSQNSFDNDKISVCKIRATKPGH